ncbi:MAG: nuclear transport factor 2 family protein [Aestuariivirga sp.]|uniref:nuclear transport factor 2 family protein n=1 Tax=Aestuariivirga sp. TaxID=2650926 RepID=UPI0025BECAC4|nr:nuclear transport factor 2 family protein [Aestuariivirga sp.]MCA3561754.1 nuclear transport factor 2 family protein [Aestuariivirga sp.]
MSLDPVALLKHYHAALNAYDACKVKAMFAEEAVYVSPGVNGRIAGRDAIIAAFTAYFAEHPGQRAVDDEVCRISADTARSLWRLEAIARSTGQRVNRPGTETVRFGGDGLIRHVEVIDA